MTELVFVFALFVCARIGGWLARKGGAESAVGEILAGVFLAALVPLLPDSMPHDSVLEENSLLDHTVALSIGVLLLLAGIDLKPDMVSKRFKAGLSVAVAGVIVPFATGAGAVWIFLPPDESRVTLSLLAGLSLSITAIPAVIKILEEFNAVTSTMGATTITAALLDDIIGLILLALFLPVALSGTIPSATAIGWLVVKVGFFYALTIGLGQHIFVHVRRGLRAVDAAALELSVLIVVACLYSIFAELLGLHWILGPFMAGLFFEPAKVGKQAYEETRNVVAVISNAALGPIFFASIGAHVDIGAIGAAPLLLALLVLTAFLGKIIGAGGASLAIGLSRRDAMAIGIGMSARGAVGIVVLDIAYSAGIFQMDTGNAASDNLFSLLVITAVITTAAVPPLLRRVIKTK